jgi:HAE1 family hydrophobic/amphiphilic exporter-1
VLTGENLQEVGRLPRELQRKLATLPGSGASTPTSSSTCRSSSSSPDRLRIADAGLSTPDVALAINMLTGGVDIAKFNDEPGDGQRYDIRVKAVKAASLQPAGSVEDLPAQQDRQAGAPRLGGQLQRNAGPGRDRPLRPAIRHHLLRHANHAAGEAVELVKAHRRRDAAAGYQVKLIGQAEEFGKTRST